MSPTPLLFRKKLAGLSPGVAFFSSLLLGKRHRLSHLDGGLMELFLFHGERSSRSGYEPTLSVSNDTKCPTPIKKSEGRSLMNKWNLLLGHTALPGRSHGENITTPREEIKHRMQKRLREDHDFRPSPDTSETGPPAE